MSTLENTKLIKKFKDCELEYDSINTTWIGVKSD